MPKEKVISVHPRDVRHWNYGGKKSTLQEQIDAFTIYKPACHHAPHAAERKIEAQTETEAVKGIAQIEEFLKKQFPKK